jgi:hypothetical protein
MYLGSHKRAAIESDFATTMFDEVVRSFQSVSSVFTVPLSTDSGDMEVSLFV